MAGLTHSALRTLIAEAGGTGLLSTEMLSARSLPHENIEKSPYLIRSSIESPISAQVLVSEEEKIAPAFEKLHIAGVDAIDINLGCRAPKVIRRGAGYALSRNPTQLEKILKEARKRTDLPLTAKIRLGRRADDPETVTLVRLLEDCGIDRYSELLCLDA
jgi:tRNA-dihydrouridine synthase